ncbi:SIMPL domain-containing protein [Sphingomonas xanthus]|uniref:SIMPL domain-containing protein n=1 Tax=Sphingomonas xanthus TaxID=2594473 RepID=A0A516ISM3_9SPHN|nr:SIMPL domain-containing protein [Sphingomonas xanthus]QDP19824.1 SIMPL domain-containing protein [Sphingomonas xanthus]
MKPLLFAAAVTAAVPTAAGAQAVASVPVLTGTRVDVNATGEVTRVPDLAVISAGVQTLQPTATGAIEENATRMERVRAALKRAGIADKDIQTSTISLNPEYRYQDNQPPRLTGYRATNTVNIKFRDLKRTGAILDALVQEGANQINGPSLTIDKPDEAYDEARVKAVAAGRARAEIYARSLGKRVVRILSVSESGAFVPPPMPYAADAIQVTGSRAKTEIDPGTQQLQVNLSMSFELQ